MKRSTVNGSKSTGADAIQEALTRTNAAQSAAADPQASVWVNANAGTGKTHVLTQRVLRLLLSGTKPERILCLTYTKAAAAEMSKRVFDTLGTWVTETDEELTGKLKDLTGTEPDDALVSLARTLFTSAIETPGGLKVQTIHAFAERLLQRFPLEAGLPPGFGILDDVKARELKERAIAGMLEDATASPASPLGKSLALVIRYAADQSFDELLTKMMAERSWLIAASRLDLGKAKDDFKAAEALLARTFGADLKRKRDDIVEARAGVLPDEDLGALRDHLSGGGKTDLAYADLLSQAAKAATSEARADCLAQYFMSELGKSGEKPREKLMSKGLGEARADLLATAEEAQARFSSLTVQLQALTLIEATGALYRLAGHALQYYTDSKRAAGTLDFDDLIERTMSLLATSSSADWVLYKLDGGLDHILVDEAQDTSPEQWAIIAALGQEFFSGSSARDGIRTIFAVGDEKQSIYSFQGAAPEKFAEMGRRFAGVTLNAGLTFRSLPLNLSFRSAAPVLDAVDRIFADTSRTRGVGTESGAINHVAKRFGQAGLVEIWPTEAHAGADAADPWQPLSEETSRAPVNRLAERIAALIAHWLKSGETLASGGRPIRPGDILILVRKRHPFAIPMVAALKAQGIPVAGSDRIALTDQIAVKDLIVLGDFLTLPEDDLALATVLKSPLFDLTDDDLFAIASGRKGSLWKALLAHADANVRYKPAAEALKRWRAKADFTPPFEFYSALLDRDGVRSRFLHRLGPEAADAIDEFVDIALTYDDGAPPSLTGFLAALRQGGRDVKRDMEHGRNEVRVMTVHGAKGLEAPIVFLPDTCTTASGEAGMRLMKLDEAERPVDVPPPVVWPVKGTSRLTAVRDAVRFKDARETEERNRLLYVALTRARDRLYISGFENKKGRADGCWYDLITAGLEGQLAEAQAFDGARAWRLEAPQSEMPDEKDKTAHEAQRSQPLPAFALRRAAAEEQLSIPLAPSRLEPYAPDAEGEPILPPRRDEVTPQDRPTPRALKSDNRFLRGTITHALLEHLPSLPAARRAETAKAFVASRGKDLTASQRTSIVRETLAILDASTFAALFSESSRAEVPLSAVIPRPRGRGPALKLSGQIDRLAVTEREVLIVDYKTNRPPPRDVIRVAPAYLFQLAAYVLALSEIYPDKQIRCALLWTDGPNLMEIPGALINQYITRLWDLDPASLSAAEGAGSAGPPP